jgi:hypothetical protein
MLTGKLQEKEVWWKTTRRSEDNIKLDILELEYYNMKDKVQWRAIVNLQIS